MFIIGTNFLQIKVITMMKKYDQSVEINHNPNWPDVPDHPYRMLIIAVSGSGKTKCIKELNKKSTTRY